LEKKSKSAHDCICNIFLEILTMRCQKIKPLCESILSPGDDVAGAVNILCWVNGDEGMRRMCVGAGGYCIQLKFISTARNKRDLTLIKHGLFI
jgi:hypothetical protein